MLLATACGVLLCVASGAVKSDVSAADEMTAILASDVRDLRTLLQFPVEMMATGSFRFDAKAPREKPVTTHAVETSQNVEKEQGRDHSDGEQAPREQPVTTHAVETSQKEEKEQGLDHSDGEQAPPDDGSKTTTLGEAISNAWKQLRQVGRTVIFGCCVILVVLLYAIVTCMCSRRHDKEEPLGKDGVDEMHEVWVRPRPP